MTPSRGRTRQTPPTVADGWVPNQHGIPTSYNRGCRCDECRAAHAKRKAKDGSITVLRRKRFAERVEVDGRLVHPNPYGGHGSITASTSCGCRCEPCTQTRREYNRAYAKRRGQKLTDGDVR